MFEKFVDERDGNRSDGNNDRGIIEPVIACLEYFADQGAAFGAFSAARVVVETAVVLVAGLGGAAAEQARQFAVQGEGQPKGSQPQRQHSHHGLHGTQPRRDPHSCKRLSGYADFMVLQGDFRMLTGVSSQRGVFRIPPWAGAHREAVHPDRSGK